MYSKKLIEEKRTKIERKLGRKLVELSLGEAENFSKAMTALVVEHDQYDNMTKLSRTRTEEEEMIILNERLMCGIDFEYWANRYCNPPEAPIWMADGTFRPLGDIQVDDLVMGWAKKITQVTDPCSPARLSQYKGLPLTRRIAEKDALCPSRVLAIRTRRANVITVYMESGAVLRCTPDHAWANGMTGRYAKPWTTARPRQILRKFVEPVSTLPVELQWYAGWLAGMYDGEGCGNNISQSEMHNLANCQKLAEVLHILAIPYRIYRDARCNKYILAGGRDTYTKFLMQIRPNKSAWLRERILGWCKSKLDRIRAIEDAGHADVVSMQTTTGNYVVWGYASKNCTITKDGSMGGGQGTLLLWEAQTIVLDLVGKAEEKAWGLFNQGLPCDGIRIVDHKSRQLGGTALKRAFDIHRVTTQKFQRGLVASVDDEKIHKIYERDKLIIDHLPWYLRPNLTVDNKDAHIAFGGINSTIQYSAATQKGGLGQGEQFDLGHLTECSSWPDSTIIEFYFFPVLPQGPNTFCILESTANGIGNWWHEFTERVRQGRERGWVYCFIPWYAEPTKYRAVPPVNWRPNDHSLLHAKKVLDTSSEFVGRRVELGHEQLYWYECGYEEARQKRSLNLFLGNYAATPEESFQHTGISAFDTEFLDRLRLRARPGVPFEALLP